MEIIRAGQYELVEILYLLKTSILELTSRSYLQWGLLIPKLSEDVDKCYAYIIKKQDISVGLLILDPQKKYSENSNINWDNSRNPLYINQFVIHPKWFSKDIGDNLIESAEKYANENGFDSVRFEAYAGNNQILNLFESSKYKRAGEINLPFQNIPFVCFEKLIN